MSSTFYLIFRIFYAMVIQIIRRFFTTVIEQPLPTTSAHEFLNSNNTKTGKLTFPSSTSGFESLEWLFTVAPCFPIHGDQIEIIHEPHIFYETILQKCSKAQKRIVLASLYLGTGNLEKDIIQAMQMNLKQNSQIKMNILLDFQRGTRGNINSKSMLLPLIKEFNEQFKLSLYHTPALRGITKRIAPSRWNELLGLQHMKIYLFDDSVIISGANLSNDYFTNRQDRYVLINDRNLANFYEKFIEKVKEFSLSVNKSDEIELHKNWNLLPYEATSYDFGIKAKERISNFFNEVFKIQEIKLKERQDADTWVFPLIEMGQLGIHHDSVVTKRLLSSTLGGSKLKLATGYFNLTEDYMNTITNECLADCSILMAHPNANGFQGASGPAGGIPAAYSLLARTFYERLCNAQQSHRIHFYEYQKDGWTYHAKGLWYYLPNSKYPNLTLIGSSNFGERSVNRDLEAQICVVTCNEKLQKRLQNEVDNLFKMGSNAENAITSRPVPKWVQAVVKIFKNFF